MVLSSKDKKSDLSSLFSIEVGSTQITDGFKQLRDYYLRLLDDDTELRKEIENNFFCDENGGVITFKEKCEDLFEKKQKIINDSLEKFGVDFSEFVEDIINNYEFAEFIRDLSVLDQTSLSKNYVKILKVKYRTSPSSKNTFHRLDLKIDDIDFHINNQRILNYLKNKGLEKYIDLIENVGNQLLIGNTLQDRVYCTNYNTNNLKDDDVSRGVEFGVNDVVSGFFKNISKQLSYHITNSSGVYYSFTKNKISFKKEDKQDQLLVSNMKFKELDKMVHKTLWSKNEDKLVKYLYKQILSAIKNKVVKLFDYKFNLAQVRDGKVPLILLSDDQINNSLKTGTILKDLAKVIENTQDEKQINRLIKALEGKLKAGFN